MILSLSYETGTIKLCVGEGGGMGWRGNGVEGGGGGGGMGWRGDRVEGGLNFPFPYSDCYLI